MVLPYVSLVLPLFHRSRTEDWQVSRSLVMAWCHQATSHYLSQCWPRSMSPNGITRPHWVNIITFWCCMKILPITHSRVLFKPITVTDGWDTCCEIALRRMSPDLTDDESTIQDSAQIQGVWGHICYYKLDKENYVFPRSVKTDDCYNMQPIVH